MGWSMNWGGLESASDIERSAIAAADSWDRSGLAGAATPNRCPNKSYGESSGPNLLDRVDSPIYHRDSRLALIAKLQKQFGLL
jgi:hypothetical protein